MFKKIEPLQHSKHKDLRLSKNVSMAFANDVSSVRLSFSEVRQASRYYPIVFFENLPCLPHALLSLQAGTNMFVDDNGNWKTPYVPAHFRLYPFTLARIQEQEGQFSLCIDPDAEHFKSGMGEPLFTADGELSDFVRNILKSLERYQKEINMTKNLLKTLDEQDMITERAFTCRVQEKEKRIDGFMGVDMEKLLAMDDSSIAGYVKSGLMGMVYEHSHSLYNFSYFFSPAPKTEKLN
ncbi:MAG: SapC family protein [Desulfobacterales bacterium]|nr:SapC family protein [Desulfobacterales bacterium]